MNDSEETVDTTQDEGNAPVSRESVIRYLVAEYAMIQADAEHMVTKWNERVVTGAQLSSRTYYVGDEIVKLEQIDRNKPVGA